MGSVISSRQFYRTDRAISWFVRSWFVQVSSRRDHGMNPPFRPLTCVIALAVLAGFSSDAALARHKPIQHAKKADAAGRGGHHRHPAPKKGKQTAHVAAARREAGPSPGAPPQPPASPLSGDLPAGKQADDL